jgi:RES domain-containing protein
LRNKNIKARPGGTLKTAASKQAMRAARATMTAAEVLGSYDAARTYMHTRNFALGGARPAELLRTSDGDRIVLNELHAQAEGAPLWRLPLPVDRASRRPRAVFEPLDSSASVVRDGWRFNGNRSEILCTAELQALAMLELAAHPGWDMVAALAVAGIAIPDDSVVDLADLGLVLSTNWNARPAAQNAQSIGAEFLAAVDREAAAGRRVCGLRVPSVIGTTDHNVLLDPRQKSSFSIASWSRIPFNWLAGTGT